jgi:glycosyltransferase involved in cell wall biosynthesis
MRALYISHNGVLEPLGQSQVLPYIRGLARLGVEFDLLSYETSGADAEVIENLRALLSREHIRWFPLQRTRDPRLAVKVQEAARGVLRALAIAARRRPNIVHGRGYLPTAVGDAVATLVPRAKLIFDCRGMLADEYVDAGYWTRERPEYALVKRYEARAFRRADGVVVLTNALREWVQASGWLGPHTRLETIPTCVDLERFRYSDEARVRRRQELGLEGRIVLVYSGSLGALYREDDLARFAAVFKMRAGRPSAFLVLTQSPSARLVDRLKVEGLAEDEIVVRSVAPQRMAEYLAAGDAAVAFGKTCFARLGCSPTKLAEYFACGLPALVNDFGDQASVAMEHEVCLMADSFSDSDLRVAADRLVALAAAPVEHRVKTGRAVAERRFGLATVGIPRYAELYRAVASAQLAG